MFYIANMAARWQIVWSILERECRCRSEDMFSAATMVADRLVRVSRASLGACVHMSELATPIGVITHHEMIVLCV